MVGIGRSADPASGANRSIGRCDGGPICLIMRRMNSVLTILIDVAAVIGCFGMALLVAGGVASMMMDHNG